MSSVRKRYPELRRSNRDRQAVYKSLDENVMGIQNKSAIFRHILEEANDSRRHGLYDTVDGDGGGRRNNRYRDSYPPINVYRLRGRHFIAKTDSEDLDDEDENLHEQCRGPTSSVGRSSGRHVYKGKVSPQESHNKVQSRLRNHRAHFDVVSATPSKVDNYGALHENEGEYRASMYERVKSRRQNGSLNGSFPIGNSSRFVSEYDDDMESVPKRRRRGLTTKLLHEVNPALDEEEELAVNGINHVDEHLHDDEEGEEVQNGNEDKDDVNEEEEVGEDAPKQYYLRQKRAQVTRFGYTRDLPRACRSSLYGNGISTADASNRYPLNRGNRKLKKYRKSGRRGRYGNHSSPNLSSSTSSTSSDDEEICTARNDLKEEARFERRKLRSLQKGRQSLMPTNMSAKDFDSTTMSLRQKLRSVGTSCADIDPMQIDSTVGFGDIGGLTQHIQSLKEVVVFPLLYSELFQRFDVTPPKGTGKTLVARALANECSRGNQKVAFFMRKGADCLSKWVGESERQLRLLFDQAYSMRPSIIFFDEIDGLAPVRSSRQDQIHSSIVSTLLALMDGLDKRGEIIVIGATNRLDSIDPALRRPGRFDREMRFDLPDKTARESILHIHTKSWKECKPNIEFFKWLAENTSGYCGADLKALCTESVLVALREKFPHIYLTSEKLLIDPTSVQVEKRHFEDSMRLIVPAARRDFSVISHQLNPRLSCLIKPIIDLILAERIPEGYIQRKNVDNLWKNDLERVIMALKVPLSVPAARLLIHGKGFFGQTTHFLPVLINCLDHLPIFSLSCEQIFASGHAEENVSQVVRSALRATSQGTPIVLLMPDIDLLEHTLPTSTWKMVKRIFRNQNVFEILPPSSNMRFEYFKNFLEKCKEAPVVIDVNQFPEPPKAPKESNIRKVSTTELKEVTVLHEQMLRQFRIALRDLLGRLVRDRRFNVFNLPVDKEDAEDYYDIIQNPMCLSQMMAKIDQKCYNSKQSFLDDIRLIMNNALEYNPNRNMEGKTIRHNAFALMDMAEALFETDLDDDLIKKLEGTENLLKEDEEKLNINGDTKDSNSSKQTIFQDINGESCSLENEKSEVKPNSVSRNGLRKRRYSRGGYSFTPNKRRLNDAKHRQTLSIVKKYKSMRSTQSNDDEEGNESIREASSIQSNNKSMGELDASIIISKEVSQQNGKNSSQSNESAKDLSMNSLASKTPRLSLGDNFHNQSDNIQEIETEKCVQIDTNKLEEIVALAVNKTDGWGVPDIECLGAEMVQCIESFRQKWDRNELPRCLEEIIYKFFL